MIHSIFNQYGNHIIDHKIRSEIIYALEKDMTYTYYEGNKISIRKDVKSENERVTTVVVEGI